MKYRQHIMRAKFFTLMEVIVAMAVFSIMMGILLQFFTSTQKLWSSAENKNALYADARAAMDLMASSLQSQHYTAHTTFFIFGTTDGKSDALYFPVKMPHDYGSGEELFYLSFMARNGKLYLRTYGSKDNRTRYKEMFTRVYTDGEYQAAINRVRTDLGFSDTRSQEVIDGVVSFVCTPINAQPGNTVPVKFETSGDDDDAAMVPFAVRIELELLSGDVLERWKALGGKFKEGEMGIDASEPEPAKNLRLANQYKFSRIIYLGFQ